MSSQQQTTTGATARLLGKQADGEAVDDPGDECPLERATWRLSRRRLVGADTAGDERGALALIEAWRKAP